MKHLTEFDKFWIALGLIAFLIVAAPALIRMWIADRREIRKYREKHRRGRQRAIDYPDEIKL
ncbi:hypothetical protein [Phaeodactylibacter xiamenensis]|jgi:hypothetical protein|uniref:hypothetical protein n=1 Tax=Phaeodactylibacter xiamenensis TaxID=1524460 RepID=UPI0024A879A1|nr:hypothetical protein [Phaeodactylibacter xiamenensis]